MALQYCFISNLKTSLHRKILFLQKLQSSIQLSVESAFSIKVLTYVSLFDLIENIFQIRKSKKGEQKYNQKDIFLIKK